MSKLRANKWMSCQQTFSQTLFYRTVAILFNCSNLPPPVQKKMFEQKWHCQAHDPPATPLWQVQKSCRHQGKTGLHKHICSWHWHYYSKPCNQLVEKSFYISPKLSSLCGLVVSVCPRVTRHTSQLNKRYYYGVGLVCTKLIGAQG